MMEKVVPAICSNRITDEVMLMEDRFSGYRLTTVLIPRELGSLISATAEASENVC